MLLLQRILHSYPETCLMYVPHGNDTMMEYQSITSFLSVFNFVFKILLPFSSACYVYITLILYPSFVLRVQFLFSFDAAEELKDSISNKNHELVLVRGMNLVDEIWGDARPEPPKESTRVHDIKYAGIDVPSKLLFIRSHLTENGCDAVVISMLDEVAWLLNMVIFQLV